MEKTIDEDKELEDGHYIHNNQLVCEFSGGEIESVIYDDETDGRLMADIADGYRIYKGSKCVCGLIVYAKYHNKWVANPHNSRAVIQYLLKKAGLWNDD